MSEMAQDPPEVDQNPPIDWFSLVSGLLGGVALSSMALKSMSSGLKEAMGPNLKKIIQSSTSNVLLAFATGTVATALLSSSTATSRLVVELVQGGAMTFQQSLGVSLGINVGSTVAAQLVALKLTKWSLLLAFAGYVVQLAFGSKHHVAHGSGLAVYGLGVLFLGIDIMGRSMDPLKSYEPFHDVLLALQHPLAGALAAALLTSVVQSSAVVIAIVMTLAEKGVIPLGMAVSLVVGANVGTCSSALLSAIGGRRESLRVALTYLLYKFVGAVIMMFGINMFANLIARFSHVKGLALAEAESLDVAGMDILQLRKDVVPATVANAHLAFNLIVGVMFLPFPGVVSIAMMALVPPETRAHHDEDKLSDVESPMPSRVSEHHAKILHGDELSRVRSRANHRD